MTSTVMRRQQLLKPVGHGTGPNHLIVSAYELVEDDLDSLRPEDVA
jgi:hypothetical protein